MCIKSKQNLSNQSKGGCREYLPGGKFENWRTDERLRESMSNTLATTNLVESSFGVTDEVFTSNNNLGIHTGTNVATWLTNHTKVSDNDVHVNDI